MEFTKNIKGNTCNIKMVGKFTFADHISFKEIFVFFDDNSLKNMEIDLSCVEFVDSAALGLLLLARDEAKKNEKLLIIKGPKGQVKKMFEVSRFYDIFEVVS